MSASDKYITVVEHGYNTSGISSILVALFYNDTSYYNDLLDFIPDNIKLVYIQELIKNNFVEPMKKSNIINISVINEIKNMLLLFDLINKEQFYNTSIPTIYNLINCNNIRTEYIVNNDIISIPYITINLVTEDTYNLTFLIKKWLIDNVLLPNNSDVEIKKIPLLLPIFINRNNNHSSVDIKYQIKPFHNMDKFSNTTLSIQSLLCYNKENNHYYTIFYDTNKWVYFSDKNIPSFSEINMKDTKINSIIKKEVILIFYKYDDIYV